MKYIAKKIRTNVIMLYTFEFYSSKSKIAPKWLLNSSALVGIQIMFSPIFPENRNLTGI